MGKPSMDDYIDVAERIEQFYARFEDGRLTERRAPWIATVPSGVFVVYTAAAYRTPDDPYPGIGTAWEPVPGKTSFTRDSEMMNAETSAWGRAILACGFASKGRPIASANEVRARTGDAVLPAARKAELQGLYGQTGWKLEHLKQALDAIGVKNVRSARAAINGLNEAQANELAAVMQGALPPLLPDNDKPLKGGGEK